MDRTTPKHCRPRAARKLRTRTHDRRCPAHNVTPYPLSSTPRPCADFTPRWLRERAAGQCRCTWE